MVGAASAATSSPPCEVSARSEALITAGSRGLFPTDFTDFTDFTNLSVWWDRFVKSEKQ